MEHQNESEIFNSFFNLDYEEQSGTGNAAVSPNLFTLGEHAPFPPVNDPIPWSEPMDSRLGYGRPPGNPSLGPTPIDETLAADISKEWSKRAFKCVVWEVENAEGLPHTCTGPCEKSMSDLLRHLRRKHFYVESCPCCHQHIYNEEEFETKHGKRGRNWCTVTQKQRRGKALDDTYESLYEAARSMDPQLRNLPANQRARNEGLSSTASSTIPVVGRSTPQPIFRSEFQPSSGCYRWTGSEYSWVAGGVNISKDGTGSSHHLSPPGILLQPAPAPDPVATYPSPFWSPYQPSSISSHYTSAERQRPEPGEEQNKQTDLSRTWPQQRLTFSSPIISNPTMEASNTGSQAYSRPSMSVSQSVEYEGAENTALSPVVLNCPKGCGTALTGIHAAGNLTRHLKSCTSSPKPKSKYQCPVYGCGKEYTRSDGLKVHVRKRHPEYQGGYE